MVVEVEQGGELRLVEPGGDRRVLAQQLEQRPALAPGRHRVALHQLVGLLARQPGLGQRQQHALRAVEALAGVEVAAHPLRIDHQPVDQPGEPVQREVGEDAGVGQHHPLDRAVRDVALVPERRRSPAPARPRPGSSGRGRSGSPTAPGCACAAWPSCPSARPRTAPRPRRPRCAADGGSRSPAARSPPPAAPGRRRTRRGGRAGSPGSRPAPAAGRTARRPSASTRGSTLAKVPTAPDMAQVMIS